VLRPRSRDCSFTNGRLHSSGVVWSTADEWMLPVQPIDRRCAVGCLAESWTRASLSGKSHGASSARGGCC